ncbi:MAG: ABC transporter substrate-binding protein, partial [Rhodospirillales bacterium]|nr:ABC transporter substrate-binding protein [Rhodospirillales bacterium]
RTGHAQSSPLQPVQDLVAGLLAIMKAGQGTPFSQRAQMLGPVIDRTFDLEAVLRASVGPTWASFSPDQQRALLAAFRRYTVNSYVNSFDQFNGQRFLINPETRSVGAEEVVRTQIVPTSGDTHELDYVMRNTPNGWRIVDVLADGAVSRVAVQRSDFRTLLRQGGADRLQRSLDSKADGLAN